MANGPGMPKYPHLRRHRSVALLSQIHPLLGSLELSMDSVKILVLSAANLSCAQSAVQV